MYQFIECPLYQRKLTLDVCQQCPHNRGVMALVLIEQIGDAGQRLSSEEREIPVDNIPPMVEQLGNRVQVSERMRWVDCHYPRVLRIDIVHGELKHGLHV